MRLMMTDAAAQSFPQTLLQLEAADSQAAADACAAVPCWHALAPPPEPAAHVKLGAGRRLTREQVRGRHFAL